MIREITKIGVKLAALLFPFFVICPVLMSMMPMRFLDEEYPVYRQNKDWAQNHTDYTRILIMGDSTAEAAWIPERLSEDTYNFALMGASPVEEYYYLLDYLRNNRPPMYIFYMQDAAFFQSAQRFWDRSVYFHRMRTKDLKEVIEELNKFDDQTALGGGTIKNFETEVFLYRTYSPVKYSVAFFSGLFGSTRYKKNTEKYEQVAQAKGHNLFGNADSCERTNISIEYEGFAANEFIDMYFRKLIELCEEYHIKFIFRHPPINECTYMRLQEQFKMDYCSYFKQIQEQYPKMKIDTELHCYDSSYFGDANHVNGSGAVRFSDEMRMKYQDIFGEAGE